MDQDPTISNISSPDVVDVPTSVADPGKNVDNTSEKRRPLASGSHNASNDEEEGPVAVSNDEVSDGNQNKELPLLDDPEKIDEHNIDDMVERQTEIMSTILAAFDAIDSDNFQKIETLDKEELDRKIDEYINSGPDAVLKKCKAIFQDKKGFGPNETSFKDQTNDSDEVRTKKLIKRQLILDAMLELRMVEDFTGLEVTDQNKDEVERVKAQMGLSERLSTQKNDTGEPEIYSHDEQEKKNRYGAVLVLGGAGETAFARALYAFERLVDNGSSEDLAFLVTSTRNTEPIENENIANKLSTYVPTEYPMTETDLVVAFFNYLVGGLYSLDYTPEPMDQIENLSLDNGNRLEQRQELGNMYERLDFQKAIRQDNERLIVCERNIAAGINNIEDLKFVLHNLATLKALYPEDDIRHNSDGGDPQKLDAINTAVDNLNIARMFLFRVVKELDPKSNPEYAKIIIQHLKSNDESITNWDEVELMLCEPVGYFDSQTSYIEHKIQLLQNQIQNYDENIMDVPIEVLQDELLHLNEILLNRKTKVTSNEKKEKYSKTWGTVSLLVGLLGKSLRDKIEHIMLLEESQNDEQPFDVVLYPTKEKLESSKTNRGSFWSSKLEIMTKQFGEIRPRMLIVDSPCDTDHSTGRKDADGNAMMENRASTEDTLWSYESVLEAMGENIPDSLLVVSNDIFTAAQAIKAKRLLEVDRKLRGRYAPKVHAAGYVSTTRIFSHSNGTKDINKPAQCGIELTKVLEELLMLRHDYRELELKNNL